MVIDVLHSHKWLAIFPQVFLMTYEYHSIGLFLLYYFVLPLLVPCDDISYRAINNPCIQIIINLIDNDWITGNVRELFGP